MTAWMIGSSPTNQAILDIFVYLAILVVIAAALVALGVWLSRRLRQENQAKTPGTGFSLADLKKMHHEGRISDEEFERARQNWIKSQQQSAGLPAGDTNQSRKHPDIPAASDHPGDSARPHADNPPGSSAPDPSDGSDEPPQDRPGH